MANYSCENIADYFICFANEAGSLISNLKLQKLVYYAQAWHLANFNESLFDEDFRAWVHGPVIHSLWKKYKKFGFSPIIEKPDCLDLEEPAKKLLQEVADVYLPYDAYALELMSHKEDPWLNARAGLAPYESSRTIISKESMKNFFKQRISTSDS